MNNFANQFDMAKKIEELQSQLEAEKKKVAVLVECINECIPIGAYASPDTYNNREALEMIYKVQTETLAKIKEMG